MKSHGLTLLSLALFAQFGLFIESADAQESQDSQDSREAQTFFARFDDPNNLSALDPSVEGRFRGPVKLQVWQHWQPSWNVELQPSTPTFILQRGRFQDGRGYVVLDWITNPSKEQFTAQLSGRAYLRADDFRAEERDLPTQSVPTVVQGPDGYRFIWRTNDFTDVGGLRSVTAINFEIWSAQGPVFDYRLRPMLVRGPHNFHWSASPSAYMAHAGAGTIEITNLLSPETGADVWNGVPVGLAINFTDKNVLSAGAEIGRHRHERNVERWTVSEGGVLVRHGMAPRQGNDYRVKRGWSSPADLRDVTQFDAFGGWEEERILWPREMALIVPNPNESRTVCYHGLTALTAAQTVTDGTKN